MKTSVVWKDGMELIGEAGSHHISMDAKPALGQDRGATPKELVALGLAGCTAMDVIALLKKNSQIPKTFRVDTEVFPTTGAHPIVFKNVKLVFTVEGNIDEKKLVEATQLSQTKYCGVSAMLSKAMPIDYSIVLNGKEIGMGSARFETQQKEKL